MIINLKLEGTKEELAWLADRLCAGHQHQPGPAVRVSSIFLELPIMGLRQIKGTQPDAVGTLKVEARDKEGSLASLPTDIVSEWVTSDNDAVSVTPDPSDPLKVTLGFGTPNADGSPRLASVQGTITSPSTGLTGVVSENFAITAGDAENLTVIGLDLPGLPEPTPDAPPVDA